MFVIMVTVKTNKDWQIWYDNNIIYILKDPFCGLMLQTNCQTDLYNELVQQLSALFHCITILLQVACLCLETDATTTYRQNNQKSEVRSQGNNSQLIVRKCFHPREEGQIVWHSQEEHILTREDLSGFSDCQWLALYNMNVSDIEDGALSKLSKLSSLSLSNNKLKSLRAGMFRGSVYKELESLRIPNNSISSIEKYAFNNLKELEFLYLDHNPVGSNITPETFGGLQKLFVLDLSYTGLSIVPGLFQHIPELSVLGVNGNPFKYIPNMWEGVKLRELGLGYSNITELKREFWDGLEETLTTLNLGGNNISTLHAHTFQGLKKLFTLTLVKCGIEVIEQKAFEGAPALTLIWLLWNPILTIDENIFGTTIQERPLYMVYDLMLGPDFFHCSQGMC